MPRDGGLMHIAGGVYKETCELPAWNAEYGSGGRAAAAVCAVSSETVLHTYAPRNAGPGISHLREMGIDIRARESAGAIAFAYFHPLSEPHVEPAPTQIHQEAALRVSGETVLRFSFLEGDALVEAGRAIYDPQMSGVTHSFDANGSRANELALVLNEFELRSMAAMEDLSEAADRLLLEQRAVTIVVKRGPRGALVFDSKAGPSHVPAFRSSRVFKIGTGVVFSAMFAHYWGEVGYSAVDATVLASRAVASYCESRLLPIPSGAGFNLEPVGLSQVGAIALHGRVDTLGRRYVIEEARFGLTQLGATVICPALDSPSKGTPFSESRAVLVLVDSVNDDLLHNI